MRLQDFFHSAFYINLECRPNRRADFEREFARVGLADYAQRVQAVDATQVDQTQNLHARGAACGYSHQKILQIAKDRGLDRVLIFEDDAKFYDAGGTPGLAIVEAALDELQSILDWDLFYLGGLPYSDDAVQISPHIFRVTRVLTTHAIGVHSRVYDKLLNFDPAVAAMDAWFCDQSDIVKYVVYPLAVIQADYPSDVARFPLAQPLAIYTGAYSDLAQRSTTTQRR